MTTLTRQQISTTVLPDWQDRFTRTLPTLKSTYPGSNTDLLGRQLIVKLELKTGQAGMVQGVLYRVYGQMKDSATLKLLVMQPGADTESFDVDLTPYDTQFKSLK